MQVDVRSEVFEMIAVSGEQGWMTVTALSKHEMQLSGVMIIASWHIMRV